MVRRPIGSLGNNWKKQNARRRGTRPLLAARTKWNSFCRAAVTCGTLWSGHGNAVSVGNSQLGRGNQDRSGFFQTARNVDPQGGVFILTTNRPEALEAALASRPGRVDQAIEFPLPDDIGREKLVTLYAKGARLPAEVLTEIVRRTQGVSAAFIKELLRRIIQFHIERNGDSEINRTDVDLALDEMLFSGGSLNLKLLGAGQIDSEQSAG